MARQAMEREIRKLKNEVLLLGSMAEEALLTAVDALCQRSPGAARKVFRSDQEINNRRFAIENAVLILIATQQPMAHDLRFLTAVLEVTTELERIGDYAKGIAKVVLSIGDEQFAVPSRDIQTMANKAISMLHRALGAFISEDEAIARIIPAEDDEVDAMYESIRMRSLKAMIDKPELINMTNYLLWVGHNLERTADRATNICERAVFITSGELVESLEGSETQFPV
jgi:phosphate transport system protein